MTYTELTALIQQYCESYEAKFVAAIPQFVRNAEQRIYNTPQLPALRADALLAVDVTDTTNATYLLPANFLAPHSLAVVTGASKVFLLQKDYEYLQEAYPNDSVTDTPQYYALTDSFNSAQLRLRIAPCPPAAVTLNFKYFAQPTSIVTAGTTWLGTNFESALLWGSILEGYIFNKGEAGLIQTYETRFEQQLSLLKGVGDAKDRQDTYRTLQTKVPVQ